MFIALLGLYIKVVVAEGCRDGLCDRHQTQRGGKRCSGQPLGRGPLPAAPGEAHIEAGFPLAAHAETIWRRIPPAACGESCSRANGHVLKEAVANGEVPMQKQISGRSCA